MKIPSPIHLGDGAYLSFDGYQFWLAANHHDHALATDLVAIPYEAVGRIVEYKEAIEHAACEDRSGDGE